MTKLPVIAEFAVVSDPPGEPTTLTLYGPDGPIASLIVGPVEAVALAGDLIASARRRFGRPPAAGSA